MVANAPHLPPNALLWYYSGADIHRLARAGWFDYAALGQTEIVRDILRRDVFYLNSIGYERGGVASAVTLCATISYVPRSKLAEAINLNALAIFTKVIFNQ
jgi:hypothetical protein